MELGEITNFFYPLSPKNLNDFVTLFFNITIAGLFIVALLIFVIAIYRYRFIEKYAIKKIESNIPKSDLLSKKSDFLSKIKSRSVSYRFVSMIINISQKKGNVQLEVIQRQIYAQIMSNPFYIFAEGITRVLIIIGLLGTLIGMGLTVHAVIDMFKNWNKDDIESMFILASNLEYPIEGMKTAIATSIMGLFSSLFLYFLNIEFRSSLRLILANANATISAYILPQIRTRSFDNEINDLRDLITSQEKIAEKVDSVFQKIDHIKDKFTETIKNLGAIQDRFNEIISNMEKMVSSGSDTEEIYKEFRIYFTDLIKPFNEISKATSSLSEELHSHNLKVEEIVETLAEKTALELTSKLSAEREKTIEELSNAISKMTEQAEKESKSIADRVLQKLAEMKFGRSGYIFHFPSSQPLIWFILSIAVVSIVFTALQFHIAFIIVSIGLIFGLYLHRKRDR